MLVGQQPAADALILLKVRHRDIPCIQVLDTFHANQALQASAARSCAMKQSTWSLSTPTGKDQGSCLIAKIDIPASKRLTLYACLLSQVYGSSCTHYMYIMMGDIGQGYPWILDGTPRAQAVPAQFGKPQWGRCIILIDACQPHANTRLASLVCDVTGISVFYVESICPIPKGAAVLFSYQTTVTQTSYWRLEGTLGPPPSSCERRKCL